MDLKGSRIPGASEEWGDERLYDYSLDLESEGISVYFRGIEQRLLEHIAKADVVVGCVAWLTNTSVLEALSEIRGVSIIVQKEDFLRRDCQTANDWQRTLRSRYNNLIPMLTRRELGGPLRLMRDKRFTSIAEELATEWFVEDPMDPVRCVGMVRPGARSLPRMHNKFLVFAKYENDGIPGQGRIYPYEVWTGSYNISRSAELSFENAVIVSNGKVVNAYYQEYLQIASLSEPLDWESMRMNPEWRYGEEGDITQYEL